MRISEAASRAGLTVRALRHYEALGLVKPSMLASGRRSYTDAEVARLRQISALRKLGLSLDDIGTFFSKKTPPSLTSLLVQRLAEAKAQRAAIEETCWRLERIVKQDVRDVDEIVRVIEEVRMQQRKYFTPEQIESLQKRAATVPSADAWQSLAREIRDAYDNGLRHDSPEMQVLARRWRSLIDALTGGDAGTLHSLRALYNNEDRAQSYFAAMFTKDVHSYLNEAVRALP